MRQYHLRIYTLDSTESLEHYSTHNYPRHIESFPKYGITAHGFFRPEDGSRPTLYVLVSYDEDADVDSIVEAYLGSPELKQDLDGFDPTHILGCEDIALVPTPGSPLV
jgi:hypothetical protein